MRQCVTKQRPNSSEFLVGEPRLQPARWCALCGDRSLVEEASGLPFPASVPTEPASFLASRPDELEVSEDGMDRLPSWQHRIPRQQDSGSLLNVEVATLDERVRPGVAYCRQQPSSAVEDDGRWCPHNARRECRPGNRGLTVREDPRRHTN